MASNKQVDLRKTEKFVRSKYDPGDILKDTGKTASSRESCMNFKIAYEHLIYKGEKKVIFDYDKKV